MTTDILGCTVFIDGERFADGREGDNLQAPLALDGLKVVWGRETTIDQPDPSTCTFQIMDTSGGTTFLDRLYVGALVQVRTAAEVTETPEENIIVDPGFEGTAIGQVPPNVRAAVNIGPPVVSIVNGSHAVRLVPIAAGDASVEIAPGPFVTGDPDAWDDILMIGDIAEWEYSVEFTAPPGTYWHIQAYTWAAPDLFGNGLGSSTVATGYSTGGTSTVGRQFIVPNLPRAEWLGMRFTTRLTSWAAFVPEAGAFDAWEDVPEELTWADYAEASIDNVSMKPVLNNPGLVVNESVVFEGSITDLAAGYDETLPPDGGVRMGVTATDFTGQINNVFVGDTPWPLQPMRTRFARVVTLANQQIAGAGRMGYVVDPTLGAINLQRQDVDRQSALNLLASVTDSVDGVLWPAVHLTSPRRYFYVENIDARTSGYAIVYDEATDTIRIDRSGLAGRTHLSACDLLRDTVGYEQSTSDVLTRVAVAWQQESTDDEGKPTLVDRTYEDVDLEAEAHLGVSRLQVSTLLSTEADAAWHADRKMRRTTKRLWRASGVVWDLDLTPYTLDVQRRAAALLDGTTRIGLPVVITDMPSWTPTGASTLPLFVEGGEYEFTGGRWVLSFLVSDVYGSGASAQWDALPGAGTDLRSSRTNYALNPSAEGMTSGSNLPGFAIYTPGTGEAGTAMSSGRPLNVPLRTNYCVNPRAIAPANGWAYQAGTGEVSTQTFRQANDGPIVEGFRLASYFRVAVTTAKTGGNSGVYFRSTAGALPLAADQMWNAVVYARVRGDAPVRVRLAMNARNGTTALASTFTETETLTPSMGWVPLRGVNAAPSAGDGFQVWVQMEPGDVLAAGSELDVTALRVEYGDDVDAPYFDGAMGFIDDYGDMRYVHAWVGNDDASRSTQSLTLTPRDVARDGAPDDGPRTLMRRVITTPKTAGDSGFEATQTAFRVPVSGVAGDKVTLSVWVRHNPPNVGDAWYLRPNVKLRVQTFSTTGTAIEQTESDDVTLYPANWERLSVTITATADFASLGWFAFIDASGSTQFSARGSAFDATGLLVERGDVVGPFFDGDSGDTGTATYEWTGTARNSPSTEVIVDGWAWDRFAPDVTWNDLSGATMEGT